MSALFTLFEHASGYALFRIKEFEEIAMLQPQVEAAVSSLANFKSIAQLVAFYPFKNAANALDNINSISEGILHENLHLFLETNLPKSTKKQKVTLGASDPKICVAIQEALGATCLHTGVVPEIVRGLRHHFSQMVKGLTPQSTAAAQLGLGHSYSRSKVKFNVNRSDNMIIQSISLLEQLDKDINTFAMRVREWYSYHFPELIKLVPDNHTYARVVKHICSRQDLDAEKLEGLKDILCGDEDKVKEIHEAAKMSMGMDISEVDMANIRMFSSRIISLSNYRNQLSNYLRTRMNTIAPNVTTLIGEAVGAKLISQAGSLINLAKAPASTIQIMGAEKALFRAIKARANTPKYGTIFNTTHVGKAQVKDKGRVARALANKISICARVDCFSETSSNVYGDKMNTQMEDRMTYLKTGVKPPRNLDVMLEAKEKIEKVIHKQKKKAKKEKKRKLDETLDTTQEEVPANGETNGTEPPAKKAKKKKKKKNENE